MPNYRHDAHTVFEIHLHLVWITKCRRPALSGEVATRARALIRDIGAQHEVRIMKGHVAKDHVHLFVSIPPLATISRLLQWLKGKTAHHPMAEFPRNYAPGDPVPAAANPFSWRQVQPAEIPGGSPGSLPRANPGCTPRQRRRATSVDAPVKVYCVRSAANSGGASRGFPNHLSWLRAAAGD